MPAFAARTSWLLVALAASGLWLGLAGGAPAQEAQDPRAVADLQRRVRELEEIVRRLQEEKGGGSGKGDRARPDTGTAGTADEKRVRKIVGDAMKERDEKKKQEDEKKKEEEQRKKEEEARGAVVGSDLTFKAAWREGLTFETPNKDFRVHVGGRMDVDFAWFGAGQALQTGPGGVGLLEDGADFRRARLRVDGTAWEVIDWVAEFDFATALEGQTNHPALIDVYFDVTQMPILGNFRVGHFREPFGFEALTSGLALTFLERSSAFEAFVPFRNVGVMLYDTALGDRLSWAAGLFRTNSKNTGDPFDVGDGEYAGTGRVTFLPWYAYDGLCLFHLGAAYSHRSYDLDDPEPDRVRLRAFPEIRTGRYIFADTGNITAQSDDRVGLEAALKLGPFSVQAEYFDVRVNEAQIKKVERCPAFSGWYVQASYFLTGEDRPYRFSVAQRGNLHVFNGPRPLEDFFFVREGAADCRTWPPRCCLGRGAWEVAVRYSRVDLNDPREGVPAQTLQDVTLGLNWYLNVNTKIQWNYILADRDFPSVDNHGTAHIFGMRFHHDF